MSLFDVPLFKSTEEAEAYGRELARVFPLRDEFQALVRTYFVSELAAREAVNQQAKVLLATRCQTLREAIQAFLFDGPVPHPPVRLTDAVEILVGGPAAPALDHQFANAS